MQAEYKNIGWHDLDKFTFFGLMPLNTAATQAMIFPFMLVKTRMQTAFVTGDTPYKSTVSAFRTIYQKEGFRAFYRGFGASLNSMITGPMYVTVLETSRASYLTQLAQFPTTWLSKQSGIDLAGGSAAATASLFLLTLTTPLEVVAQRKMIQRTSGDQTAWSYRALCEEIWQKERLRGFYRGYWVALICTVPTTAITWGSYFRYHHMGRYVIERFLPPWVSRGNYRELRDVLVIPMVAGLFAGATGAVATNWLDLIRAQIQVSAEKKSLIRTASAHYNQHGVRGFFHGVYARIMAMGTLFFIIMPSYEILKRVSLKSS